MRRRATEKLQTALIMLLTLSLLALTFTIWLLDAPIEWNSAGPTAAAARALGLVTPPPETISVPRVQYGEAARPIRIVWTEDESHVCVQLDTALTDSAYDHLKGPLGEAMGSAKQASRQTFAAWLDVLSADNLYLEYVTAVPMQALALWLAAENPALPEISVRRLALVSREGAVTIWFLDALSGVPYMCQTALPARDIPGLIPSGALPCRFGYEDADFTRAPLALLFDETPGPQKAICEPAAMSPPDINDFLWALHINPDTNDLYTNEEGTTYLDGTRTCRFSPQAIHYADPEAGGSQYVPLPDASRTLEAIEQARELLVTLSPLLDKARFSLESATASPDGVTVTVTFVYELSGLAVRLANGAPPAVLVYQNGRLAIADIRVLSFSLSPETDMLLPELIPYLALSAKHPYGHIELRLFYAESEGKLTAVWENY